MMWNLYRAEIEKIVGNRWTTGFLLWIFPVGAAGVMVVISLLALLIDDFGKNFFYGGPPLWTEAMVGVWGFPTNTLGQMFLIGLTAVTFAGEYQWGTWKNIVPRHQRIALIGVKFLALGTLVVFSFALMSLIIGVGMGVVASISGLSYGPALSVEVLAAFLKDYGLQASVAFITVLITAVYAALAAMFMRSILGGVLVGLGIVIIEPVTAFLLMPLSTLLEWPWLLQLVRFTPSYNVNNVVSWVQNDAPNLMATTFFDAQGLTPPADSIGFSLAVLAVWVTLGIGLIVWLFERQDISA